jgi:hypothetical protein
VASVTASWSLGSLQGIEELRHNEKGNYIGEIGPWIHQDHARSR